MRRPVELVRVPGKREPIQVSEVVGMAGEVPEPRLKMLAAYREGMDHYGRRRFAEAEASFRTALGLSPDDRPSATYAERCALFQKSPPASDWDRVSVVNVK